MATLYERLGGEDAVTAAVRLFYDKVLADAAVARWFSGMDMEKQIAKQIAFMTLAFGGASGYSGRDLRTAHAGLVQRGLGATDFDAIARHLVDTLRELAIEQSLIDEVVTIVVGTRNDVLGLRADGK